MKTINNIGLAAPGALAHRLLNRVCQKSIFLSNQFSQVSNRCEYITGCTKKIVRIYEQKPSKRQPLQDLITFTPIPLTKTTHRDLFGSLFFIRTSLENI